jgi:ABC-2 type transport system ATP-binding protein
MEPAIEVKNLVKVYGGKVKALDEMDLSVEAGKVFALLGPNGAGKTTLMRILTTQFSQTSGEARIFGTDVRKGGGKIRKMISYVPQEMSVWTDVSGYENLLIYAKLYGLPGHERRTVVKEAIHTMGLDEFANSMVKNYSGGMIRRLEIASALLIKPKLLFLDEPTIGLDPSARKAVWEKLMGFKKEFGVTIFFNTHYMDEADMYSDQIAIMNMGKIVKLGTAEELKRSVGGEVILLSLEHHLDPEILKKVRKMRMVTEALAEDSHVSIYVKDADSSLPHVMDFFRSENVAVSKAEIMKPTLDDVFLKYAGTRIETAERVTDVRQTRSMIKR